LSDLLELFSISPVRRILGELHIVEDRVEIETGASAEDGKWTLPLVGEVGWGTLSSSP
jgi:hypothetical protein